MMDFSIAVSRLTRSDKLCVRVMLKVVLHLKVKSTLSPLHS